MKLSDEQIQVMINDLTRAYYDGEDQTEDWHILEATGHLVDVLNRRKERSRDQVYPADPSSVTDTNNIIHVNFRANLRLQK